MKRIISAALASLMLTSTAFAQDFYKGGDVTQVNYIEDLGGKYYTQDGTEEDVFKILSDAGMNMARIRLSNNPGKGRGDGYYYMPDGYQDEADCLELAKRAKTAGMDIQFTFNYSDYWSNGTRQIIPSDWVEEIKEDLGYDVKDADFLNALTDEQRTEIREKLKTIIYDYTYDIMTKLKEQDTIPQYVSLGNEINGGILFPFANTYDANMSSDNFELVFDEDKSEDDIKCPMDWEALAELLNTGYDAVKAVSPESQVIIHIAEGSKESVFTWFFDKFEEAGGKYDIIGASYYPAWSGNTIETCVEFCNTISAKYDKDIIIMETGFNWNATRKDGEPGQLVDIDIYKDVYPPTLEGHKAFITDLFAQLQTVEDRRCIGAIYWDPCMIHVEDENGNNLAGWAYSEATDEVEPNVVENTTLFDFDGKAISTLDAFASEEQVFTLCFDENGILVKALTSNGAADAASYKTYVLKDGALTLK
ncbi:MAG: arabinogalactan endo-1,4-beta-galactosidase [Oscillospiraceae bacterium]|nr:arabinogalactan endo-1,4-beta-galactosidase [Oscillospiraceae bacterium]